MSKAKYIYFVLLIVAQLCFGCETPRSGDPTQKPARVDNAVEEPEATEDPLEKIANRLERDSRDRSPASELENEESADGQDKDQNDEKVPATKHIVPAVPHSDIKCPDGAQLIGAPPPKGSSVYCAKRSGFGSEKKHGEYRKWDAGGALRFEAVFFDDQLDGPSTTYSAEGEKVEFKEFKKGVPNGRWMRWAKNGEKILEGEFLNGKKTGYFRYWDKRGTPLSEGVLRDDIRIGAWIFYNRDGSVKAKYTFDGGRKNGKAQTYYPTGVIASTGSFSDNKPDGLWIYYSQDGRVRSRGHFMKGRKEGTWTEIDPKTNASTTKVFGAGRAKAGKEAAPKAPPGERGFVDL